MCGEKPEAKGLFSFAEAISEIVVQIGNRDNFLERLFDRVFDPTIGDRQILKNDITSPWVAVSWLTDGPDIDHCLLGTKGVTSIDVDGREKFPGLGENAGNMRVPLERVFRNNRKKPLHLPFVVNIIVENVFVQRITR